MTDVELVIKIPEEIYETLKNDEWLKTGKTFVSKTLAVATAVVNGTPLPKGHGRIADIDKVLKEMKATRTYDIPFALERVKPIIEADRSEK